MQAQEAQPQELVLVDEVAQVRAREALAGRARTAFVQRARIAGETGVPEVEASLPRERRARAGGARREHAVEHVDAPLDHLEDALGVANAHEVARLAGREERSGPGDSLEHQPPILADRQAAEGVAVEVELGDLLDRAPPQLRIGRPLRDAEAELALGARRPALVARPERGATDRLLEVAPRDVRRRADVEAH